MEEIKAYMLLYIEKDTAFSESPHNSGIFRLEIENKGKGRD